ncbi:hypothetical protein [Rhizobium sp. 42MFCr.1]|jgi:hypothetical protein|uniref:hypothetical protein n=1 Tax=Rhizobium sp. 42MFCr.1 TaxID=1048680 RepID=UPI0003725888|nr:hypothetical protein [Rhizobium sp. 42MFCr.1]
MDGLQNPASEEKAAYDRHAARLLLHMRASKRLLDSFTLRDDGGGSALSGPSGEKH